MVLKREKPVSAQTPPARDLGGAASLVPKVQHVWGGVIVFHLKRKWPALVLNKQWEVFECDFWRM